MVTFSNDLGVAHYWQYYDESVMLYNDLQQIRHPACHNFVSYYLTVSQTL
jgi:hypothetical protein